MDELSQRDDVCLFALDETGIRTESSSLCGWDLKGLPLYAEANGDHNGVNVIGATEILKTFKPYYSICSSQEGIRVPQVGRFISKVMRRNPDKEAYMLLDNHPPADP